MQVISLEIPGRYDVSHIVIPLKHLRRLAQHGIYLLLPEGDCPVYGGQGIAGDVEGEQPPEFLRDMALKVPVHHAGEQRRGLGAPYDAVELLPGIPDIEPIEIDYIKLPAFVQHHVPDVVISMLTGLGPVFQQMAVLPDIPDKSLSPGILYGAFPVFSDLRVHLPVEPRLPVLQGSSRLPFLCKGDGMQPAKDAPGLQPAGILSAVRQHRHHFLRSCPLDPALDRIHTLLTDPESQGHAHGDAQGRSLLHHPEFGLLPVILGHGGDAEEIFRSLGTPFLRLRGGTVFPVIRPALIDWFPFREMKVRHTFTPPPPSNVVPSAEHLAQGRKLPLGFYILKLTAGIFRFP